MAVELSIFCITFNQEKYLRETLDGFVNQITDFKFEVFVHDDCSSDGTVNIIEDYHKKYPDLIFPLYESENQYSKGVEIFSEIMLPKSKGKYIALCEGDDFWIDSHKLQKQYDALESHDNCSMCVHRVISCNEDGSPNDVQIPERRLELNESGIISASILAKWLFVDSVYPFHTSSYFFRREVLEVKWKHFRDVGILRKALTIGDYYFINESMSVRRFGSKGSFNNTLKDKGSIGLISLMKYDLENDVLFKEFTNGLYSSEIDLSNLNRVLFISKYDIEYSIDKLKEIDYSSIKAWLSFGNKVKLLLLTRNPKWLSTIYKFEGLFNNGK